MKTAHAHLDRAGRTCQKRQRRGIWQSQFTESPLRECEALAMDIEEMLDRAIPGLKRGLRSR